MKCYKCFAEIPDESRFCLKCGAEQLSKEDYSEETESVYIPDDIRNLFFPIKGVTLGETTADEVRKMGIDVDDILNDGELSFILYCDENNKCLVNFRQTKGNPYFNEMDIGGLDGLPTQWTQDLGITYNMPYQEWLSFFKKYKFRTEEEHHDSGFFQNLDILYAFSADNRLRFQLMFSLQKSELARIYINYL